MSALIDISIAGRTYQVACREGEEDNLRAAALDPMLAANQLLEGQSWQEALDRESPDGKEEPRSEQAKLVVQPAGAGGALCRRRHAVASATWTRAGITTRDRGDIDPLARCGFVEANSLEPAEERLARTARECPAAGALDLSRCLSDEHDARSARERDDGPDIAAVSAALAGGERLAVRLEGSIQIGALHRETPVVSSPNDSVNAKGGR